MTFLEIVKKQGFASIDDYLKSIEDLDSSEPDFNAHELAVIRRFEAASGAIVGVSA